MKVCWLTTSPAPYTINLFNEIGKRIDLSIVLYDEVEKNRNAEWVLNKSKFFKLYKIENNYKKIIDRLAQDNDVLIDGFYLSKYGYYAVNIFRKYNKKIVMVADGGVPRNRGLIINNIMSYLMNRHDYFFSSSEVTDKYFKYYKVDTSKIYHYKFTSLFEKDIDENMKLVSSKQELRNKLGFDKFVLLSVGRPIRIKGFDILLNAYIKTELTHKIDLYIVGGKPQNDIKKIVDDNKLENVHFVDVMSSEQLREYYAASDASIICSRGDVWGLVINEALSYGLPTISSNMTMAGVHFGQLGNNPIVCGLNEIEGYSKAIKDIYEDKNLRISMSKQAFNVIKEYTIENSCEDIIRNLSLL